MIGLFDSGHGGLTVWQELSRRLPHVPFLYLGDHAHAPYGSRSQDDIFNLTRRGTEYLFAQGCRLVILACNTASAAALRRLQQEWLPKAHPDRRVLGIIVPTVEAVTGVPWQHTSPSGKNQPRRTVGVFATPLTVACGAFPHEIHTRAPHIRVIQQACPDLVSLIETAAPDSVLQEKIHHYVRALLDQLKGQRLDTVILGCTHYPLVAPYFKAALPTGTAILSQPDLVADSLIYYLERHPEFQETVLSPTQRLVTTGNPTLVSPGASRFLGRNVVFALA